MTPDSGPTSRQAWLILAVLSASMFVILFDNGAVNVAFPFMERTFASTPRSVLAWVSTGYSIVLASLLVVMGRLADHRGRKRVFLGGMAIFCVASSLTALAPTPALLIGARLVQGVGSACLFATAVALLLASFPPHRRGLALGIWGTVGSLAAALGPTVGAVAIQSFGWRWVFVVDIPVGLAVLAIGPRVLIESRDLAAGGVDVLGTVLGAAGIALLTLGILQGPSWGWTDRRVGSVLVVAVVTLVAFVLRCTRVAEPALRLDLFRDRSFAAANLNQVGTQLGIFAWFFVTPLFAINLWGYSAVAGGFAVALGMTCSFVSIPVGHLTDRHGFRGVLVAGGLVAAAGMGVWLLLVGDEPEFWTAYAPGLVLFGLGAGAVGISVTHAALDGVATADLGVANSAHQAIRRVSQGLGVAMVVALLGDRRTESLAAFRRVWIGIAVGYLLSVLAGLAYPAGRRTGAGGVGTHDTASTASGAPVDA